MLVGYWLCSYIGLHRSQKQIVQMHDEHVYVLDSLYCEIYSNLKDENEKMKESINELLNGFALDKKVNSKNLNKSLIAAIQTISQNHNTQHVVAQLNQDSIISNQELLLGQEQIKNVLSLHIDKIDNDYAMIGIWGAVLSLLFITFAFYGIFKIEEAKDSVEKTKGMADKVFSDVEAKGKEVISEIMEKSDIAEHEIMEKSSGLQRALDDFNQQGNVLIREYNKQLETANADISKYMSDIFESKKMAEEISAKMEQSNNEIMAQVVEKYKQEEQEIIRLKKSVEELLIELKDICPKKTEKGGDL